MARNSLRILFVILCVFLGANYFPVFFQGSSDFVTELLKMEKGDPMGNVYLGMLAGFGVGIFIIGLELACARRFVQTIPVVMISLIFGFLVAKLFLIAMGLMPWYSMLTNQVKDAINISVVLIFTYISVIMVLQTKDEWKFIIPYVEFKRSRKGPSPFILDTSVIIDGRILDILKTGAIDSQIIIPTFVTRELQAVADSSDRLKRRRGRRGLDVLNAIKDDKNIDSVIHEAIYPTVQSVDEKLTRLAKDLGGKLMTIDFNLIKVASFQDIDVVNINDLANALKPTVLPGEEIRLSLVRPGEEPGQAVGYLDDGTMVVVDDSRDKIGEPVEIVITSVHQSSAGKMFFGRLKGRNPKR